MASEAGQSTNTLTGTAGADRLRGSQGVDEFNSLGDDRYYGYGGDDVYWLGTGTGTDDVYEYVRNGPTGDSNDVIRVEAGITAPVGKNVWDPGSVATGGSSGYTVIIRRSSNGRHLEVQVAHDTSDGERQLGSKLTVREFFAHDYGQVERIEFCEPGSGFIGIADLLAARIVGGVGDESLKGGAGTDFFDSFGGGNDKLYGYGGDDVYHLGLRTGHDTIREYTRNSRGDSNDQITVDTSVVIRSTGLHDLPDSETTETLRVRRSNSGNDLVVEIHKNGLTNSLTVDDYYVRPEARIEGISDTTGTVRVTTDKLLNARITGESIRTDYLHGAPDWGDHFDANFGGNDYLYGYGGSDVYWLGVDTGEDVIREFYLNTGRDDIDTIKVREDTQEYTLDWHRSADGNDLVVELKEEGEDAPVSRLTVQRQFSGTDSNAEIEQIVNRDGKRVFSSETDVARIIGSSGDDRLHGKLHLDDHFDPGAGGGGTDDLYGYAGSDVYWLGATPDGTSSVGRIHEYYLNTGNGDEDVIRLKSDLFADDESLPPHSVDTSGTGNDSQVVLLDSEGDRVATLDFHRGGNGNDLEVVLLDSGGHEVASLFVVRHYSQSETHAQIEEFQLPDGTSIGVPDFNTLQIGGDTGDEDLYGQDHINDIFGWHRPDNDNLYGYGGNDVYWLSTATDNDKIHEYENYGDSGEDVIKIFRFSSDTFGRDDITVAKSGSDLKVSIPGGNSLTIVNQFSPDNPGQVERIEFGDIGLAARDYSAYAAEVEAFHSGTSSYTSLPALNDAYWRSLDDLAPST